MTVQVGEHLLGALEAGVEEEHQRDALVRKARVLLQRLDRRAAVLPVVDHEAGVHRDSQEPIRSRCWPLPSASKRTSPSIEAVSALKT